jgi:hypothetical protein
MFAARLSGGSAAAVWLWLHGKAADAAADVDDRHVTHTPLVHGHTLILR